MYSGIDVSRWQGNIDWVKVKASGINFAIIKAGGSDAGAYQDKNFINNVWWATVNGIHCGAYYFVGKSCKTAKAGLENAQRFEKLLKQVVLEYPVYIDFEAPDASNKQGIQMHAKLSAHILKVKNIMSGYMHQIYQALRTDYILTSLMHMING